MEGCETGGDRLQRRLRGTETATCEENTGREHSKHAAWKTGKGDRRVRVGSSEGGEECVEWSVIFTCDARHQHICYDCPPTTVLRGSPVVTPEAPRSSPATGYCFHLAEEVMPSAQGHTARPWVAGSVPSVLGGLAGRSHL